MPFDIAVVGAGPAGLSFARALAGAKLSVALVEKLPAEALAEPPFDGREIALTQLSARLMREIGQWQRIDPREICPLRRARAWNGRSAFCMTIDPDPRHGKLGFLVSNHLIRRAAFRAAQELPEITLFDGRQVRGVQSTAETATLNLDDGRRLEARLVVAADSRHSETRRGFGIAADMHDFGRTMLVCRMALERPHAHTAWEWFDYRRTLALLPLPGNLASVVITLPRDGVEALLSMNTDAFSREVEQRFEHRLGAMRLASTRHAYPLVAVYARRFAGQRFVCIGDCAVGMHPVTAHGFNLGLRGACALADRVRAAWQRGLDIGAPSVLRAWEREHRMVTRPLYLATNAIAQLYGSETAPAKLLRALALRAVQHCPPLRNAIGTVVSDASGHQPLPLRLAELFRL